MRCGETKMNVQSPVSSKNDTGSTLREIKNESFTPLQGDIKFRN